jgi:UDP-N-acetylglucosamine transferase subunit ALG13
MISGTFISLGNSHQPFTRFLAEIEQVIEQLPKPVLVQRGHTNFVCTNAEVVSFMDMRAFNEAINTHSLIILHGGAGSIIQALAHKKIPVVMARKKFFGEHIDDHQIEFVARLSSLGLIVDVENKNSLLEACASSIEAQTNLIKHDSSAILAKSLIQLDLDKYENQ